MPGRADHDVPRYAHNHLRLQRAGVALPQPRPPDAARRAPGRRACISSCWSVRCRRCRTSASITSATTSTFFTVQEPHPKLTVTARQRGRGRCRLSRPIRPQTPPWDAGPAPPWKRDRSSAGLDAYQFVFDSPYVRAQSPNWPTTPPRRFRRPAAAGSRPRSDAAHPRGLPLRPTATTVATPLHEVLKVRRGVCQDFAHLADRLPAFAGPGRPLRQRLPADQPAARPGRAWSAPTPRTPGCRSTARRSAGSTSTRPTTRSLPRSTSRWPGAATTTTSARSRA